MPAQAMSRAFRPFHEAEHDLDYTKLAMRLRAVAWLFLRRRKMSRSPITPGRCFIKAGPDWPSARAVEPARSCARGGRDAPSMA